MIRRTILEWQSLPYGTGCDQIPEACANRLAAVAAASPFAGTSGGGVLEHGRKALRARGVVGVIAAQGCTLEILPKIEGGEVPEGEGSAADGAALPKSGAGDAERKANGSIRRRLIHMLAVALDMEIDAGAVTALNWQAETTLEILIGLFARKLAEALRKGMPRGYAGQEDDLAAMRGRLNIQRQFTALAVNPAKLACRFDALTPDVALNRIMKAAVSILSAIASTAENQRLLRELSFTYADITPVPVAALEWDKVTLDRTNARWRELVNLARLLLGNRFQSTSSGSGEGFALLFEMNVLFEEYTARMLRRTLAGTGLTVTAQGGRLYCLQGQHERPLFQTRPDIVIKRGDTVVHIIDTKWKRISSRIDDAKHGVSQADVYQMMAYSQIYACESVTLLYPHRHLLHEAEGRIAAFTINPGTAKLHISTLDVSHSRDILCRLAALV